MLMAFEAAAGVEWIAGLKRFCDIRHRYGYDISLMGAAKAAQRSINRGSLCRERQRGYLSETGRAELQRYCDENPKPLDARTVRNLQGVDQLARDFAGGDS